MKMEINFKYLHLTFIKCNNQPLVVCFVSVGVRWTTAKQIFVVGRHSAVGHGCLTDGDFYLSSQEEEEEDHLKCAKNRSNDSVRDC